MGNESETVRAKADKAGSDLAAFFTRRPAVGAAAALMAGIFAHTALPHFPLVWMSVAAISIAIAIVSRSRPLVASAFIAMAVASLGVTAGQLEAFYYPANDIGTYATDRPRLSQIELAIDEPPRILSNAFGQYRAIPPKQVVTGRVLRIMTWNGWAPASGDILVQIDQPHPELASGQRVRILGLLERPGEAMNPGQFDWASYYREQRILTSFHVRRADNITILETSSPSLLGRARERTRRLLAMGFDDRHLLDHALLRALLLGDSDPQLRDVQEQFQRTGTSHHLSISGMHVGVLGGFIFLICRILCCRPRTSAVISTLFVVAYGLIALPSPPVVRSVLLCVAFGLGMVLNRSRDAVQLLAVSVMAMLMYHPLDLYNAGFQLSFGTVLGLMLFTRHAMAFLTSRRDPAIAVAQAFEKSTPLQTTGRWIDHAFVSALAASAVAWWVSMPLIAFHFEQLNPWAIPASIILAPIVLLGLIGGLCKVVLTLIWPGAAGAWAWLAAQPMAAMRGVVEWLSHFPGSSVPLPAPSLWLIATFYLLLIWTLRPSRHPGVRWCLNGARALSCLSILVLPFHTSIARPVESRDELRMTLLGVGAGQCAVVEPPSGRTLLVDAGSSSLSDLLRKCLGPYLRTRGHTDVDTIILSHANYDHFSATAEVTAAYDVHEVLIGSQFERDSTDNAPAEGMLKALELIERPPRMIVAGDHIPLGRETFIDALWPPAQSDFDANNTSVVLRLTHGGRSILFTGDIQADAERELMKTPDKLKADVLVAPHHGSSEDTTAAFVEAVNPQVILCSNDRTLSMKQRRFDEITKGRTVYRTHECGAITVRIGRDGSLIVEPFLNKK